MDAIREQFNKPWVVAGVSFVVGLLIGLFVLGWWWFPVQWTDAGPVQLRVEYQEDYLRMAIDSYTLNQDAALAQLRLQSLGEEAEQVLAAVAAEAGTQDPASIKAFQAFLGQGQIAGQATPVSTPTAAAAGSTVRKLLPWFCLVTLVLALALVGAFLLRGRFAGFRLPALRKEPAAQPQYPEYVATGEEPPLAQFMTTYQTGNDLFDDSFSIDSQAGEFLGECGVGISETIGVGEPKRATAFEVWLFDKNDIQTVTQVLMSRHAFDDEGIRQRLAAKGEPISAEPGRELILETATLRLMARVVDMSYGSGALPPESYFDRLTLQLVVWPKA